MPSPGPVVYRAEGEIVLPGGATDANRDTLEVPEAQLAEMLCHSLDIVYGQVWFIAQQAGANNAILGQQLQEIVQG